MNAQDSKAEIFDVFLCHNSEDKPAVREIAQKLAEKHIKPWLDEEQIRPGTSWQTALEQQIESIKSAAVFVGDRGVGPWQRPEIQAFLNQFVKRECAVIPVVLDSVKTTPKLPLMLENLEWVDFRVTDSRPLQRLIWGITGEKPAELAHAPSSQKPATKGEACKFTLLPSGDDHAATRKVGSVDLKVSDARLYPPLAESPNQDQAAQLEILRRRVKEYWVDGVLKHSLYNEVLISLGKRQIDEAVDAPWKYTVELSDAISSGPLADRDANAIYDTTGLLLILGEPGSGKTTTLLDLARTLLDRARDDIKERVPIVLNLSSWKTKQPLAEWISSELSEKYRVPRKIARFWLRHDYLLPLLDGLDEIETSMQPDCVAAINAFIEELKLSGLVVCCRLNEYRWLPERLKLNGAICLEPLSSEEVSKYLAEGGPTLEALREAVNTDTVLHELTQTPLMLSIMSLAYQGADGNELARQKGDSPEERRKQIFRLYVEQMFQRKGMSSLVFPKEKIISWLSWLARKMREHSQSVFLVEGLQPSWLGTRANRAAYGTVVALSFGLIFAPTVGLIVVLTCGLISLMTGGSIGDGLIGALIFGLIGGLITGLIAGVGGAGSLNHITLVETISWKWNRFWKRTIPGLIGGLIGGLIFGLIFGAILGLVSGLVGGLTEVGKAFPNQGIKLSLRNSLAVFLVTILTFGLIGGLIGVTSGSITREGLIFGLIVGLIFGLNRGGSAVIKHYALRLILWLNGYTPFRFVKFLDHCARLILLKKVGGGYIFIHRMLLEYFAEMTPQELRIGTTGSVGP